MAQAVLVAGAYTPIGKLLGSLSGLGAAALGGAAVVWAPPRCAAVVARETP